MNDYTLCTVEGCAGRSLAKSLCSKHYLRLRRTGNLIEGDPEGRRGRATAKFHTHYTINPITGCHVWHGCIHTRGYGCMWFDGRLQLAHRIAWQIAGRELPTGGLVLDHICEVKPCVNVEHLRVLTNRENIMRSPLAPMNVLLASDTCRHGHPYPNPPERWSNTGTRRCRECEALRKARGASD